MDVKIKRTGALTTQIAAVRMSKLAVLSTATPARVIDNLLYTVK